MVGDDVSELGRELLEKLSPLFAIELPAGYAAAVAGLRGRFLSRGCHGDSNGRGPEPFPPAAR